VQCVQGERKRHALPPFAALSRDLFVIFGLPLHHSGDSRMQARPRLQVDGNAEKA
jgi:hypothetical protein